MLTITSLQANRSFSIYINEVLHFSVKKEDYVGMQSWKNPSSPEDRLRGFKEIKYAIEIYTKTNHILLEYDEREKWEEVLKRINGGLT